MLIFSTVVQQLGVVLFFVCNAEKDIKRVDGCEVRLCQTSLKDGFFWG